MTRILLFLLFSHAWAFGQAPRWSIHTHPGLIAGLSHEDFLGRKMSPLEIPALLQDPVFVRRLESFLDLCVEKGIEEVIVDGIQPELAGMYFRSPLLETHGWKVLFDVFEVLREKANQRRLRVGIGFSELGIHSRGLYERDYGLDKVKPLAVSELEPVLDDLVERYGLHSVTEEEFPSSWFLPLRQWAEGRGIRYVHRAHTDDIVSFAAAGERTTALVVYSGAQALSTRDYFPVVFAGQENGVVNGSLPLLMPGHARFVETSAWFSGPLFLENLVLFRTIDSAPEEFSFRAGPKDLEALSLRLRRRVNELVAAHDPAAPVLNLVVLGKPAERLDAGQVGWLQLVANLEPILLGAGAAGLRTVMTEKPVSEAAAYYVYLAGPHPEDWMGAENFLRGVEDKPVIVQLGAPLSENLLWRVMSYLEIREAHWQQEKLPTTGTYLNQRLAFQGIDLYEGNVPAGYLDFKTQPQQVLMRAETKLIPLIYRHPRSPIYFVNGNVLHREMAFPVSQLLSNGRGLQKPAVCFIAVGKKTAFWALQDTEVDWIHPGTGLRLVLEMKKNGFHIETSNQ